MTMPLSFSRINTFLQCRRKFELKYILKKEEEEVPFAAQFGTILHEALFKGLKEAEGEIGIQGVMEAYDEQWALLTADGPMSLEYATYQEGNAILLDFIEDNPEPPPVVTLEQEFDVEIEGIRLRGVMDRVDRKSDKDLEIIDYKSNRMAFNQDQANDSLQLSIYDLVARKLWPLVGRRKLSFYFLRHRGKVSTSRTEEQAKALVKYLKQVVKAIEDEKASARWEAKLNDWCSWCGYREGCPAYEGIFEEEADPFLSKPKGAKSIKDLAREREDLARRLKVLKGRKDNLDKALKGYLAKNQSFMTKENRYSLSQVKIEKYPLVEVLKILGEATGLDDRELAENLGMVDKGAMDRFLKLMREETGYNQVRGVERKLGEVVVRVPQNRLTVVKLKR